MNNNDMKLTAEELNFLKLFRSLTDVEQDHIMSLASECLKEDAEHKEKKVTIGFTKDLFNL